MSTPDTFNAGTVTDEVLEKLAYQIETYRDTFLALGIEIGKRLR